MSQGYTSDRHIPALDGLRGLAILLVLFWHYVPAAHPFFPGWAGVDLFFALSGYLITGRLLATQNETRYFSSFYRRRALRILPLYFATTIPFFLLIWSRQAASHPPLILYAQNWPAFMVLVQNWVFVHARPQDLTLLPTWSIAIEEQFYIIWPVCVYFLLAKRNAWKLLPLLILIILIGRTIYALKGPDEAESVYYNTLFRMDALLAGSLLRWLTTRPPLTIFSPISLKTTLLILLLTIMAGSCLAGNALPHNIFFSTIGFTLLAIFFTALIQLLVTRPESPGTRIFDKAWLRYCGKISYGLYIFNFPVLSILGNRVIILLEASWPEHTLLIQTIVYAACLGLTFLLSALSFRYFEKFFLALRDRPLTSSGTSSHTHY